MARRNLERFVWCRVSSSFQSKLALLDRADATHRGNLVFGRKLTPALVAQSLTRLPRRCCFFHRHVWLARRTRRFVSKRFSARTLVAIVDLSRSPLCILGLVRRVNLAASFHRFLAEFAGGAPSPVRVGHTRVRARMCVHG